MINQPSRTICVHRGGLKLYLLPCGLWADCARTFEEMPNKQPGGPCSEVYSCATLVNCLRKRFHQDWLCRERLGVGRKVLFYYCESVYGWGVGGHRGGRQEMKVRNRQGEISETSLRFFFRRLKGTLPHKNLTEAFHFRPLFYPGVLPPPCDSDQRLCLYLPSRLHHVAMLNTVFDQRHRGRLSRPLPRLRLRALLAQQRAHIKQTSS